MLRHAYDIKAPMNYPSGLATTIITHFIWHQCNPENIFASGMFKGIV